MFRPVKVKALKRGYYGRLRDIGEEFQIATIDDLGSWMDVLKAKASDADTPEASLKIGPVSSRPGGKFTGKLAESTKSTKPAGKKSLGKGGAKASSTAKPRTMKAPA